MRFYLGSRIGPIRFGVSLPVRLGRQPRAAVWRPGHWEPLPEQPPREHVIIAWLIVALLVMVGMALGGH